MGSEYKGDGEKSALGVSQTQFSRSVINRFDFSKTSSIPDTPSVDLRHASEEETVVDTSFHEIVGSLIRIADQTRPDIENAVREIARFSHDPKPIHHKATQKILEYLNAASDLGSLLKGGSNLESIQLDNNLDTYVDADYAHKAEGRHSVSCVAISCRGTLVCWLSRTQKCVDISTSEAAYVAVSGSWSQGGSICEGDPNVAQFGADVRWRF